LTGSAAYEGKIGVTVDVANNAGGGEHERGRLLMKLDIATRGGLTAKSEAVRKVRDFCEVRMPLR
jgi:hypothetical protein